MSFPNIPDVSPAIELSKEDAVNLLLASIAFEELGLAHVINAEAEKVQYALGTLEVNGMLSLRPKPTSIDELLEVNASVDKTLSTVIKTQMLLLNKLEDTISLSATIKSTTSYSTTTTHHHPC